VSGSVTSNVVIPSSRSAVVLLANSETRLGALSNALVAELLPQSELPVIAGAPSLDVLRRYLSQLASAQVDRTTLSDDFNAELTPALERAAAASIAQLGGIGTVTIISRGERGGFEYSVFQMTVGTTRAVGTMYRAPNGKIEQVLFTRQ
jgi:hypothetical protein